MSETQKAIFYMHEISYTLNRKFYTKTNSTMAREFTASTFSEVDEDIQDLSRWFIWNEFLDWGQLNRLSYEISVREALFIKKPIKNLTLNFKYDGCQDDILIPCETITPRIICHNVIYTTSMNIFNVKGVGSTKLVIIPNSCLSVGITIRDQSTASGANGSSYNKSWSAELRNGAMVVTKWSSEEVLQPIYFK